MQDSGSLAVFKVTARDQGHYNRPSGAFVTYCNISCLNVKIHLLEPHLLVVLILFFALFFVRLFFVVCRLLTSDSSVFKRLSSIFISIFVFILIVCFAIFS